MSYFSSNNILYTSKKYEDIYIDISKKNNIRYHELFVLLASIGFKRNKKVSFKETGREFRLTYLNEEQRTIFSTILLEDRDLSISIEDLENKEKFKYYDKALCEYAQGGMEILLKEVFPPGIEDNTQAKAYKDYIIDIMNFVYIDSKKQPF